MCGIALIVSGIRFDLSSLVTDSSSPLHHSEQLVFSADDLKDALRRRGPDSLGSAKVKVFFSSGTSSSGVERVIESIVERGGVEDAVGYYSEQYETNSYGLCAESPKLESSCSLPDFVAELYLVGATLQLRGTNPIVQPLVDTARNILVYNGEIFGGIHVARDDNDAETLLQSLGNCCSCVSSLHRKNCYGDGERLRTIPEVLSTIKGPWSIIYWQDSTKTLWFARDALGRRSLLAHWPTGEDSRFLLSSVSPASSIAQNSDFESKNGIKKLSFWEELPCGIYSMSIETGNLNCCLIGKLRKHEWTNELLQELIKWERTHVEPKYKEMCTSNCKTLLQHDDIHSASFNRLSEAEYSASEKAEIVLTALRESVIRRTSLHTVFKGVRYDSRFGELGPVAVLFSGGLDSMILAALLDECLDISYEIDLLNVSFDGPAAPDRISAKAGVKELRRIAPSRRWKLVEIDADMQNLIFETKHVTSLINPANTYMDLNIGIALWLAAGGDGWVYKDTSNNGKGHRIKYKSEARILLVGSGADEQCAGYGRHRTKYRNGSWLGLHEEMKLDMQRIWKRNLGRDDRCIADNGKEARFPFLDEDVIRNLLDLPLWEVADLDKPSGTGDKKILREVAKLLGLHEAAVLPKRAIQFGSRIARESNRKNFGSNRAANQASAGSVKITSRGSFT